MPASTWALVPLKASASAKSRLAAVLDREQRRRLFFALAERVIQALHDSRNIDGVAVATSSPEVAEFATSLHAMSIMQKADNGMSPALESALQTLQAMRPERVLMVPGDLPLISARAVNAVCDSMTSGEQAVLVPDRRHEGTNALLCSPPQVLTPRFGHSSFARHLGAARAVGVATRVVEIEDLALDLDRADDLDYLRSHAAERSRLLLAPPSEASLW